LVTDIVTVSPSRHLSSGPGIDPLIAVATALLPVKSDRRLIHLKIEMAARQHRRFANSAAYRQRRPSPQIESRDHAAGDQSVNETAAGNSFRSSLATSARTRPTPVTVSFKRHQTNLQSRSDNWREL
jgi:hypothetical protein